ncbi:MAG: carbohydrate binding domain-containing protein [Candidatus Korobacteraceae bacterium]|jgi:tetratricopeptide (TPR) repeat protein
MGIALRQNRNISLALLSGCILVAGLYGWFAARDYESSRLASSLDLPSLERAIALAPGDAAHQDLLCRYLLFDKQDAAAAIPYCKRATELNSYQSAYWLHLALAYYRTGAEPEQQDAILKAVSVDPTTPDVAWEAANFFLVQGKVPEALRQFSVVIGGDPSMVTPALDLCWRALRDVNPIEAMLPPDPEVYLQFIKLLIAKNEWGAAQHVWSALLQLNRQFDYRHALFYVDALLQHQDVAGADEAWKQLASRSSVLSRYNSPDNLIVNADFAEEILNGGLDWRYSAQPGTAVSVDTTQFHTGNQSVLISYSDAGGNSGLSQYVPVKPDTRYTVAAWVKSEELRSANGPVISVSDAYNNTRYALTPETLGTTPWHVVENSFQTAPTTRLVIVRIVRDPANTRILGQLWINDISLRPIRGVSTTGE